MAVFKGTFFLRQYKQGWTENWYVTTNDADTATDRFSLLGQPLMKPRAYTTVLDGARIIQVDPPNPRVSRRIAGGLTGTRGAGTSATARDQADVANTAALMAGGFGEVLFRPNLIRGLWDADVGRLKDSGIGNPSPGLLSALKNLADSLVSLNAQGQKISTLAKRVNVTEINDDPALPGFTRLIGPGIADFPVDSRVKFTGVPTKNVPWLKGLWRVVAAAAGSITIGYNYDREVGTFPGKMKAVQALYTYPSFTGWTFLDFRTRKTGRPFGLTRGRSRGIPFRR